MITRLIITAAEIALGGLLAMLALQALHHDVHAVPALGYWAGTAAVAFLLVLGRLITPRRYTKKDG